MNFCIKRLFFSLFFLFYFCIFNTTTIKPYPTRWDWLYRSYNTIWLGLLFLYMFDLDFNFNLSQVLGQSDLKMDVEVPVDWNYLQFSLFSWKIKIVNSIHRILVTYFTWKWKVHKYCCPPSSGDSCNAVSFPTTSCYRANLRSSSMIRKFSNSLTCFTTFCVSWIQFWGSSFYSKFLTVGWIFQVQVSYPSSCLLRVFAPFYFG